MLVLSIGTGQGAARSRNTPPSNTIAWARPAINGSMEGSATAAHQTVFEVFLAHESQSLQVLPDTLGQLTSLQTLDLSWCSSLRELPDLSGLTSLQTLDLSWCTSLEELLGQDLGKTWATSLACSC